MKSILIQSIVISFILLTIGCEKVNKQSQENKKDTQNIIKQESYDQKGICDAKAVRELTGLKWKFKAGSKIISSPIFNDGSIFFGEYDGIFYSINITTGLQNWKFSTKELDDKIESTPIISDETIYFSTLTGNIYELDSCSGINTTIYKKCRAYNGPSIILVDNNIYFLSSRGGSLISFNLPAKEQKIVCDFTSIEGSNYSTPFFNDYNIYFVNTLRKLYSYDMQNELPNLIFDPGPRKWRYFDNYSVKSSPVVSKDFVYYSGSDRNFYCIDIKANQEKWRYKTNGFINSTPVVYNDAVYFGNDAGSMYAVNISTGKLKWKFKTEGKIVSTPSITEDILYFGNTIGVFYAIDLRTGLELWNYKVEESITSSALILDGLIVFGSYDSYIYALY
jgi:eukaryotic-like serine/threonine-protein kinase